MKGVTFMHKHNNDKYKWAAPVIHNERLARFVKSSYTLDSLERLMNEIAQLGVCKIFHWSSGAVPAVRPDLGPQLQEEFERGRTLKSALGLTSKELKQLMQLGHNRSDSSDNGIGNKLVSKALPALRPFLANALKSGQCVCCALGLKHIKPGLEAAAENGMLASWDRDTNLVSLGETVAVLDPTMASMFGLPTDNWKRGLFSCMKHHYDYRYRFTDIIENRRTGFDYDYRPHIMYDGITLAEMDKKWGYAQNDALGLMGFNLFYHLNSVRPDGQPWLTWDSSELQPMARTLGGLLVPYFEKVRVYEDYDFSAWEDFLAKHSTSILTVAQFLIEQGIFVRKHGPIEVEEDGRRYEVTAGRISHLLQLCREHAYTQLPNEFVRSERGDTRAYDLSLLIPLVMGAISGRHVIDDPMKRQIINFTRQYLMGAIGIRRYLGDIWNGQTNNPNHIPGEEAEWTLGDPMLSFIFGDMYINSDGDEQLLQEQILHLNRTIGCIDAEGNMPESWIVDPATGQRKANINNPLQWPIAMLLLALYGLKKSLLHKQAMGW